MAATVPFDELAQADLIVDAVYEGGTSGNAGDDPIGKLLPVGNSGGIRFRGRIGAPKVIALVTSGADADWPDWLDVETGVLTYFGDNKRPGHELHETSRRGNQLLRNIFDWSNGSLADRQCVPPILVFGGTGVRRNHRFLGLAVPGASHASSIDELVGIWRSTGGQRYQNYRALFTISMLGRSSEDGSIRSTATTSPTTWRRPHSWPGDRVQTQNHCARLEPGKRVRATTKSRSLPSIKRSFAPSMRISPRIRTSSNGSPQASSGCIFRTRSISRSRARVVTAAETRSAGTESEPGRARSRSTSLSKRSAIDLGTASE